MAGLALASLSCLSISFNPSAKEPFYTLSSLLAASPILLFLPPDVPDPVSWAIVLVYWAMLGALMGWFLGRPGRRARIFGVVLIAGVALVHALSWRVIMDRLQETMQQGLDRLFHILSQGGSR